MTGDSLHGPAAAPPASYYALIGGCRTAALVTRDGSTDRLWLPSFSGASVFARLLDSGGAFTLHPSQLFKVSRPCIGVTAVLEWLGWP